MTNGDLADIQRRFSTAILAPDETAAEAFGDVIAPGALTGVQRLRIHRNNYREGLSKALLEVFPLSVQFVGEEFLQAALKRFVVASPPVEPQLYLYGGGFADFLADFAPAQQVPYLADLVRLEWVIHRLQHVAEEPTGDGTVEIVESAYPLMDLWLAATGQCDPEKIDLDAGGQRIVVVLVEGEVRLQRLDGLTTP